VGGKMKPIGPLMREHRLIERMITLLKKEFKQLERKNEVDIEFLLVAVDFIRTYADRTHHGKEEDILFRELAKKSLSQEHKKTMNELIEEHKFARKVTTSLAMALNCYNEGNEDSINDIAISLQNLVKLYPAHIEKEDKHFFYPCLEYLSTREQDEMLQEFWEFDRKLIHEKYENIVEALEKGGSQRYNGILQINKHI
jgi:hemerythrin-like domain-containing protein